MWAMELKPYEIKYEPRTIMEEQVLVNFIVEFTSRTPAQSDLLKGWTLNVDGASNSKNFRIRIVLTTTEGTIIEHSYTLGFSATNNKAEYKLPSLASRWQRCLE